MCDDDLHLGVSDDDFVHLSCTEVEAVALDSVVREVFAGLPDLNSEDLAPEVPEFDDSQETVRKNMTLTGRFSLSV